MKMKTLVAATLASATLLGGVPLRADRYDGRYDGGRYDRRDDYHRDDHRRDDYRRDDYRRGDYHRDDYRRDDRHRDHDHRSRWDRLGSVTAAGRRTDRDVIEVRGRERYGSLMFRVEDGDVVLEDLKVTFGNDSTYTVPTKLFFREGERSCRIELPGYIRDVKRVRFLYRSAHRGPATIEVYGKPI